MLFKVVNKAIVFFQDMMLKTYVIEVGAETNDEIPTTRLFVTRPSLHACFAL